MFEGFGKERSPIIDIPVRMDAVMMAGWHQLIR